MNLNQLKLFYLAIKRQSLSNAAAELNITQPAVTKGIQRLQEYYEIKFVERQGIKLVLTKAGTALYEIADKIFTMEKILSAISYNAVPALVNTSFIHWRSTNLIS